MSFVCGGVQQGSIASTCSALSEVASTTARVQENTSKSSSPAEKSAPPSESTEACKPRAADSGSGHIVESAAESGNRPTSENVGVGVELEGAKKGFGVNDFTCTACCVALASEDLLDQHNSSRRHKDNVIKLEQSGHAAEVAKTRLFDDLMESRQHGTSVDYSQPAGPVGTSAPKSFADDSFDCGWNEMEQLPHRGGRGRPAKPRSSKPTAPTAPVPPPPTAPPRMEARERVPSAAHNGVRNGGGGGAPAPILPRPDHHDSQRPRHGQPLRPRHPDEQRRGREAALSWPESNHPCRSEADRLQEKWRHEEERRRYEDRRHYDDWLRGEEQRLLDERRHHEERRRYDEERQRWNQERRQNEMDHYFHERTFRYYDR